MTARYNVFKDSTKQAAEPSPYGQFVGIAQGPDQNRLGNPPGMNKTYANDVENVPCVRRGHDVNPGD